MGNWWVFAFVSLTMVNRSSALPEAGWKGIVVAAGDWCPLTSYNDGT